MSTVPRLITNLFAIVVMWSSRFIACPMVHPDWTVPHVIADFTIYIIQKINNWMINYIICNKES